LKFEFANVKALFGDLRSPHKVATRTESLDGQALSNYDNSFVQLYMDKLKHGLPHFLPGPPACGRCDTARMGDAAFPWTATPRRPRANYSDKKAENENE
jgi:hypothetical protein